MWRRKKIRAATAYITYNVPTDTSNLDVEGSLARQTLVELEVEFLALIGLLVTGTDSVTLGVKDSDVGLVVVSIYVLDVKAAPATFELALLDGGGVCG